MKKARAPKVPLTFAQKVEKELPEFTAEVAGLDVQAIKNRIANYAKELEDSEQHKENNQELADAQAEVTTLAGPYKDVRKAVRMKTRYLLGLMKEKGGN